MDSPAVSVRTMNTSSPPDIAVIIPNWNGARWLPACLAALDNQTLRPSEIILIDNGSTDGSPALAKAACPSLRVIQFPVNRGFAAAVNAGIRQTRASFIALLNTDTRPTPDWLAVLARTLVAAPAQVAGIASCMVDMADPTRIENAGDVLSWQGMAAKRGHGLPTSEFNQSASIFSPCAGAAMYRRSFLEEVGLFDERFFAYLEDVDLGFRGRWMGFRFDYAPEAVILHQGHGAGLPHARYVRLITRNRILLLLKNLPVRTLLRHALQILYGQGYYLIAYRRPLQVICGWLMVVPHIPHLLREHRRIASLRRVPVHQVESWLIAFAPERPLRSAFQWRNKPAGRS
jgi:GT2 family glycosyltransferase